MLKTLVTLPLFKAKDLAKSIALSMGEGICMGLPYGFFILIVQQLLKPTPDWQVIQQSVAVIAVILVVRIWFTRQAMLHTGMMTYHTCASMRQKLANHFFRVPMGFFQQHDSGQLSQCMNKDVEFTEGILPTFFLSLSPL